MCILVICVLLFCIKQAHSFRISYFINAIRPLFIILALLIFTSCVSRFLIEPETEGSKIFLDIQKSNPNFIQPQILTSDDVEVTYPICKKSWKGLTVLDFIILAEVAYSKREFHDKILEKAFYGSPMNNPNITYYSMDSNFSGAIQMSFLEIFWPQRNLTVISVRGTSNPYEAFIDIMLFYGISLLQIFDLFAPSTSTFIQAILDPIVYDGILGKTYSATWNHILKRTQNHGHPGSTILTGHSLGGSLAAIVASRSNATAVTFASPGVTTFVNLINVGKDKYRKGVNTIISQTDIISNIGMHQNMDTITCKKDESVTCHPLVPHLCTLLQKCGDLRGRNFSLLCPGIKY